MATTENSISSRREAITRTSFSDATTSESCGSNEKIIRAILDHYLDRAVVLPLNRDADLRYQFMSVNKTWKTIITSTPKYWNRLVFNPVRLKSTFRQVSIYHSYVRRSQQAPLSLWFATYTARSDEIGKPIITVLPKVVKGSAGLKLIYGQGEINLVQEIIIPYAPRIHELHCVITDHAAVQSFSGIASGAFSSLRLIGISFINSDPTAPGHNLLAGSRIVLQAFDDAPYLYNARFHITNDINLHPLDVNLPWRQLTKLDLFTVVIAAQTVIRILQRCSGLLIEGFFTADLDYSTKLHMRPYSIHMKLVEVLRLRILHAEHDDRFERLLILPRLKCIWIEKSLGNVRHRWDIEHYISLLSLSSTTLTQLIFVNVLISAQIHPPREAPTSAVALAYRTSFHALDELFRCLPNLRDLRLCCGIYIHSPTLKKIATGELLPHLQMIEMSTHIPEIVFSVLQKRNGVEAGPSDQRLRCSPILGVHLSLPDWPSTKQEEITKLSQSLDLGLRNVDGLKLRFGPSIHCSCPFCFGS